tara:strand:+ start:334 stop:636 length:303 start_codon:yes stop_codon:yes gene_type:complete
MFLAPVISTCACAGWFSPDNYWECILDEMQNVQSDTIAEEVVISCKDKFAFHDRIFVEKRRPWLGPKTATACAVKYGKKVQTEIGARYIQSACYKLYPNN